LKKYIHQLSLLLGSLIKEVKLKNNNIEIKTTPNKLRSLFSFLKKHTLCQYKQLVDIVCSDVPGKKYRFSVSYLLHSILYNTRIVVTIKTNEVIPLPSVTQLYESAG
jgi:NADH:ubiquinone oxidoreductase subunit C